MPAAREGTSAQPDTPTAVASTGTVRYAWLGIEGHSVLTGQAAVKPRSGDARIFARSGSARANPDLAHNSEEDDLPASASATTLPSSMSGTGASVKSVSKAILAIAIFALQPSS